jgi:GntR family transcriptional regulator/MocR family aminotransferase
MVVADLLISGEYQHHLRRVRKIYLERRDCLIQALNQNFDNVRLMGAEAGTQLTWLLPDKLPSAEDICLTASARGVRLGSVSRQGAASALALRFCNRALILGFAAIACDRLRDGIARLAEVIGA